MNKRLIAFTLAAALLCCMFPMMALAANETTGETDISVTFSGFGSENGPGNTGPEDTTPDILGYEVNIPASYATNNEPCMAITANYVSIGADKRLVVSIDGEKTYSDGGRLTLAHEDNADNKVICDLYRSNTYGVLGEWMPPPDDAIIAVFEDGNTTPVSYGYIVASASAGDNTIDGTYAGTVYFTISVENE